MRAIIKRIHRQNAKVLCRFKTHSSYPGLQKIPYVPEADFVHPDSQQIIPCYRVMDEEGNLIKGGSKPDVDQELATQMYECMIRLNTMDNIFYDAQRQGRISFYMTSYGEESALIGSAAALNAKDLVLAQYREAGVLMWRGFSLEKFADQCFSNEHDNGKGRQMPIHYGSRQLHYQTISSPLATQIPQAAGAAYALKLSGKDRISVCYFGEGAASEGDFHAALNIAATRETPVLFFCRNNGFAISTPVKDQFRGDGIASRAIGYGIPSIRVDGNDVWAVYNATKRAREMIREEGRPVLVEAMTYRQGHHSTSDDSTRYRPVAEIKKWKEESDPIQRFKKYLINQKWWTEEQDTNLQDQERMNVLEALQKGERKGKPALNTMFEDIYDTKLSHLQQQEDQMLQHVAKYPKHYKTGAH